MQSVSSRRRVVAREREQQALNLRKGATFALIGDRLGINRQAACRAVHRALERLGQEAVQDAVAVRSLELARLDEMLLGLWGRASRGELPSVDRVLKILERRARYLGLDAPQRQSLEGPDGGPVAIDHDPRQTVLERLEKIRKRLTAGEEPALAHGGSSEKIVSVAESTFLRN